MNSDPRAVLNWRYGLCALDAAPARFGAFAELVALWRERRPPGAILPRRADIDVLDLRRWLGRIFIARVERDPFALRFALWGTVLTRWWGVDYTGKILGAESRDPDLWTLVEIAYFKEMDNDPFLGIATGYLDQHDRSHIKVISIDLPLGEAGRMTHVLSVHQKIGLDETPESLMPDCPIDRYF